MNRDFDQWLRTLQELTEGTEYEAILNAVKGGKCNGIAIVDKGTTGPQRICVYPKKTKGAGLVIEKHVYEKISAKGILPLGREHSNRQHYGDLRDEKVLEVCKCFLGKED